MSDAPVSDVSIDALARRCFEHTADKAEKRLEQESGGSAEETGALVGKLFPLVLLGACVVGVAGPGIAGFFAVLGMALAIWLGSIILGAVRDQKALSGIRNATERNVAAYHSGEHWAVLLVHEFAVAEFRERIAKHRARTLGADSEWGRARSSLAEAADEAQRSTAYWRERLRAEPESELARTQGRIADRLEAKLGEALAKLDARAAALRRFYNDCDARLAVMDRCNRDLEESRRLEELSGRADIVIAEAQGTMEAIARTFVAEARSMGEALGVVATVGLKSLAGEASVDNVEYLADRIIEDSDRERSTIEDLDRQLMQVSP